MTEIVKNFIPDSEKEGLSRLVQVGIEDEVCKEHSIMPALSRTNSFNSAQSMLHVLDYGWTKQFCKPVI